MVKHFETMQIETIRYFMAAKTNSCAGSTFINKQVKFDDKIEKLDKILKAWSGRNLSPLDKIYILKMFGISFLYNLQTLITRNEK